MAYYANPHPVFQPAMRLVASITNSFPAIVTTTFNHQYKNGAIVRFDIPFADGMQELNLQLAPIAVTSPTTFTIPIDTNNFSPFSIPGGVPPYVNTAAQVVPVGEQADTLASATFNVT